MTKILINGNVMRLEAEKLSARRGEELIFANLSFALDAGEALVLTGRNGAGKSTLLRVVAGLLTPEKGAIRIRRPGADSQSAPHELIHYLGHRNGMKPELTVGENLAFWQSFLRNGDANSGLAVEAAVGAVGLDGIAHLPFGYLSAGQQRRIAMARLLVAHRPVWLLDEPTAALDVEADRMFTALIESHRHAGGIVIAATHQPLGLADARELKMTGFSGDDRGVWG